MNLEKEEVYNDRLTVIVHFFFMVVLSFLIFVHKKSRNYPWLG